jgi:Flp pilus assembly protein TadG
VRRRRRSALGQAAVEMLILTPIVVMFFLTIVDFGLLLRNWVMVSNAAREGARYAALGGNRTLREITEKVVNASGGLLNSEDVGVAYQNRSGTASSAPTDRGDSVIVCARRAYTFPLLSNFFPFLPDVTVRTKVDMRLETAATGSGGGLSCD